MARLRADRPHQRDLAVALGHDELECVNRRFPQQATPGEPEEYVVFTQDMPLLDARPLVAASCLPVSTV